MTALHLSQANTSRIWECGVDDAANAVPNVPVQITAPQSLVLAANWTNAQTFTGTTGPDGGPHAPGSEATFCWSPPPVVRRRFAPKAPKILIEPTALQLSAQKAHRKRHGGP